MRLHGAMVIAIALLLFCRLPFPVMAKVPPPPPSATSIKVSPKGALEVQYIVYVPVLERRVIERDGKRIEETVTRVVPQTRTLLVPKSRFRVFDNTGHELAPMELTQKLGKPVKAHVDHAGKSPTMEQLKKIAMGQYYVTILKAPVRQPVP